MTDNSWRDFFDAHAEIYDSNVFTGNTLAEVDFLVEHLELAPGAAILDVGCGTGRHSVELARRGFAVTGLDLSGEMLARARARAEEAGVVVEWVQGDATRFDLGERFDGAICLCEGAFGLLSAGDDPWDQPLAILANISRAVRPRASVALTALSAPGMFRRWSDDDVAAGRFDPATSVETSDMPPREGAEPVTVRERGFTPSELTLLFRLAGLAVTHVGGGTAGDWGIRPLKLDEIEVMVLGRKVGTPVELRPAS
jgi:SAM-dependent methyltransferase